MSSELRAGLAELGIVDADVHLYPRSDDELLEYFEEPWRSFEFRVHERPISLRAAVVGPAEGGMRVEARAPDGGPAGSDPDLVACQLDEMARRLYVLLNPQDVRGRENPDREAAHCRAANAWMADTWLGRYNASGIYLGPLRVCVTDPALAVAPDRALGRASRFVQVLVDPATATPLDDPIYDPVYEAATRNLPVAAHLVSGAGRALLTPAAYKRAGQRGVALDLADPDAEASLGRLADSADLILIAPSASVSAGTGPGGATRRVGRPPGRRSAASPGLAQAVPKTASTHMISYAVSGPMRSVGSPSTCTRPLQVVFAEQRVRPQRAIVALE